MLNKSLCVGVLAVGLLLGFASISLADEMGGMNMGGQATGTQQQTPSQQNGTLPGTDNSSSHNMANGTEQNHNNSESTAMPGMESDHEGTSEGVNWFVVGGFLTVNLLVIGTAGALKFTKSIPPQL